MSTFFSFTKRLLHHNKSTVNTIPTSASALSAAESLLPFLNCRRRKKLKKKLSSPRVAPILSNPSLRLPNLDSILDRDSLLRFPVRTLYFLSDNHHSIPLSTAGKLHRELGFPRGRKLSTFVSRHPLFLQISPPQHLSLTPLAHSLLAQQSRLFDQTEPARVATVRKLLMLTCSHRVPLAKLHHCRHLFGLPPDFRDRVLNYPDFFRIVVEPGNNLHVLELVEWDPELAVSALERDFVEDERRVKRTFKFEMKYGRELGLDEDGEGRLGEVTTFPLVSPYSDGSKLRPWSAEAEKYRVGVVHEFLSLTLEKRAGIHHIVEFKEELCLTKHTYDMLVKQPRAFYLAGTKMNWTVFLRDAYDEGGNLKEKDPQVLFNEKLQHYALQRDPECVSDQSLVKDG